MNIRLVTYSDEKMTTSQDLCCQSALNHGGVTSFYAFGPKDFDKDFYNKNQHILEAPNRNGGKGFWLFKPFFINEAIERAFDDDYVMYADSGVYFLRSVDPLIKAMLQQTGNKNIFLFGNNHKHLHWCKMNTVSRMLPKGIYINQEQAQASVMIFKVCPFTRGFVRDWLYWCQQPGFIDDSPSTVPNHPEFREHRHDQAILTNLAYIHDIQLHWWPVQYGHHIRGQYPRDVYPQIFYHHRFRNNEYPNGVSPLKHITKAIQQ